MNDTARIPIIKLRLSLPALLLAVVVLIPAAPVSGANNPRNQVSFYLETYGQIEAKENTRVALAQEIFQRVRNVSGGNNRSLTRLEVVNSLSDPWAISLPDGHVVLSKGAIDRCYDLHDVTEACLAFILGHELAHIANNDFWHQEVSRFLSGSTESAAASEVIFAETRQKNIERELKADDDGFIFAAMAGYGVDRLLNVGVREKDFFHYWSQQTSAKTTYKDPVLGARAELLRERLTQLKDKLSYFEFGVRLAHFDYCDDAVHFFAEFQQVFPGREVLNNLGFCYLQIARQQMSPTRAYFYWMPLQLDGETRAAALTQRGGKATQRLRDMTVGPEQVVLNQAVDYLQQAIDSDPYYLPARINLAVAYLYSGQPHNARAILDEARALAPENLDIQALEALSIYEQSDSEINLLPNALARLRELAQKKQTPNSILFNLIRLSKLAKSNADLKPYAKRLLNDTEQLPTPIATILCEEFTTLDQACTSQPTHANSAIGKSAPWPLPDGGWQQLTPKVKQILAGWTQTRFDWGAQGLRGSIYRQVDDHAEALVIDQFIQMQIVKDKQAISFDQLQDYCMEPLRKRELPSGELWSCGNWAALTREQQVNELWWVAR